MRARVEDHPVVVTGGVFVLVALHAVLTLGAEWVPNIWESFGASNISGVQVPVQLGLAGVAALAGGFAGVVTVFALSSNSPQFRGFRREAGTTLRSNSVSIVASSFGSAGVALSAATLTASSWQWITPWLFELGVLLVLHATIRMIWLFGMLIRVVNEDDRQASREARLAAIELEVYAPTE